MLKKPHLLLTLLFVALGMPYLAAADRPGAFADAETRMDLTTGLPREIRFAANQPTIAAFFSDLRTAYNIDATMTFEPYRTFEDGIGQRHTRFKQFCQGVELANVHYIVHEKSGRVLSANGVLVPQLDLTIQPALGEATARDLALAAIDAQIYMWEIQKNESFLQRETGNPNATYFPRGRLMFSPGYAEPAPQNFRLVYRFDVYAFEPYSRDWVDVDASTGDIVGVFTQIHTGDVEATGRTLYNGLVSLTAADADYPSVPIPESRWHVNSWRAYDTGACWWFADPSFGANGGYDNMWFEVIDTDTFAIRGENPILKFYQRYHVEAPENLTVAGYDGWDGMNVRISADNGITWQVLENPSPAYSVTSLYSFGEAHGEGTGMPGWAGSALLWHPVRFDLAAYAGKTVRLRFAFASDPGFSTRDGGEEMFGWQIDAIAVTSAAGPLFTNSGEGDGMRKTNLVGEVTVIDGDYRLREAARGGIYTYDSHGRTVRALATDFVDDDTRFTDSRDMLGVSVHWATEKTIDYYLERHNRASYDGEGARILSYVDYNTEWNNASWNGSFMAYGRGDGQAFNPFVALDVVGHELTHGVTQYTAGLIYQNEPGALNESFSDIFGTLVEFYAETDGDWLIGEDLTRSGRPLRSLSAPKDRSDPDTYLGKLWVPSTDMPSSGNDRGGVHINCGVQNHWFYLLANGGEGVNDNSLTFNVPSIGMEDAGKIAYRALTVYLTPPDGFYESRYASINAAIDLFGADSPQHRAVMHAWNAVGVMGAAFIKTDAEALDLAAEINADPDTAELTITNLGIGQLKVVKMDVVGENFDLISSQRTPFALSSKASYTLKVVFDPTADGLHNGELVLHCDDPLTPEKKITLAGDGRLVYPAQPNILYAVANSAATNQLLMLNTTNGKSQKIATLPVANIVDVAVMPGTGEMYGISANGSSTSLFRFSATTGRVIPAAELPADISAITFVSPNTLIAARPADNSLYYFSTDTWQSTAALPVEVSDIAGLAVQPADSSLWIISAAGDVYHTISASANGFSPNRIGNTGLAIMRSLAFDAGGQLYSSSLGENNRSVLVRINTTTGAGSIIGDVGYAVSGLAMRGGVATFVEQKLETMSPVDFALRQNYPNPFNPNTTIRYELPHESLVTIGIFDILGRHIATLVDGRKPAGVQTIVWDATNAESKAVPAGLYFARMRVGEYQKAIKLVLVR